MIDEGQSDIAIAKRLNQEKYSPCRGGDFTATIVLKLRFRNKIRSPLAKICQGNLSAGYTIRELSQLLGVTTSWFYHRIGAGIIEIAKATNFGCYVFPRKHRTVQQLKQLQRGKLRQVSFPTEHRNG